jgi:hypothetical protein
MRVGSGRGVVSTSGPIGGSCMGFPLPGCAGSMAQAGKLRHRKARCVSALQHGGCEGI